jgi:hypothetical protein
MTSIFNKKEIFVLRFRDEYKNVVDRLGQVTKPVEARVNITVKCFRLLGAQTHFFVSQAISFFGFTNSKLCTISNHWSEK